MEDNKSVNNSRLRALHSLSAPIARVGDLSQLPEMPGTPSFWRALASPEVKVVMLCGTGGGFDFVHSALLVPQLKKLGKRLVFLSYSFGDPSNLENVDVVFEKPLCVRLKPETSTTSIRYAPEMGYKSLLDETYPDDSPHHMMACYARDFTISSLSALYKQIVDEYSVDALVMIDGGSDSLMRGDEHGLGDPIEDAVSVGAGASLRTVPWKFLCAVGVGADRFNKVSDGSTLRAIAELTAAGGFRGSSSVEGPEDPALIFYRNVLDRIYSQQSFRSVLSSLILASGMGQYGLIVPQLSGKRVSEDMPAYVWPMMSMLFVFDVDSVARRSLCVKWLEPARSEAENQYLLMQGRARLGDQLRPFESMPNEQRK